MTTEAAPLKVLTPELRASLTKRTDLTLLSIIRANSSAQYASQTPSLAPFRDMVAQHEMVIDATLLTDFRTQVPVTDYESCKPWIARFDEHPCILSRVDNLLAPGLPYYFGTSSSTSGKEPKLFPTYQHKSSGQPPTRLPPAADIRGPTAWILYYGYKEVKSIEQDRGQVVKRIPVCLASAGRTRMGHGWDIDSDESRLPTISVYHRRAATTALIDSSQCYLTWLHGQHT